ncbi:MAG: glycosyl transferase family 2, partial [Acidobacteriota bacterium]|nr:glycosyl transferase family 2 [Acidobacteriota bacterium]
GGTVPCMGSLLVRRDVIERVGGFDDAFLNQYDDQVLYTKICLESPVFVAGACWDKYRQHPKSSCHLAKQTGEAGRARLAYLHWLESYLLTKRIADAELWLALRKALHPYRHPTLHRLGQHVDNFVGQVKRGILFLPKRALPVTVRRWLRTQWR